MSGPISENWDGRALSEEELAAIREREKIDDVTGEAARLRKLGYGIHIRPAMPDYPGDDEDE